MGDSAGNVVVPPPGWSPLRATNAELKEYNFPQRPAANSPGYALWLRDMKSFKKVATPGGFCETSVRDNLVSPPDFQYYNWAGGYNYAPGTTLFLKSEGVYTEPTFTSACGSNAVYGMWAGLGGTAGVPQLMQAGTNYFAGSSAAQAFFELLGPGESNPADNFLTPGGRPVVITLGHHVDVSVLYDPNYIEPDGYQSGSVGFWIEDQTLGLAYPMNFYLYGGHTVSFYYNGGTSEWISEQVTGDSAGDLYPLAQPVGNSVHWIAGATNNHPISYYNSHTIDQVSSVDGSYVDGTDFAGAGDWYDTADQCNPHGHV